MNLLWPGALLLLVLVPVLAAVYVWMLRRRRRYAVRYSSVSLIRAALPKQSRIRRHLPAAFFLLALASLVFALSRPVALTRVPTGRSTIVLALDVSASMRQNDVTPSRLAAAKKAALDFVEKQQANNQIGVVAFAGYAQLVQEPSTNINYLRDAIQSLTIGRGTAIGSGILESLDTIAEVNQNVIPSTGSSDPAPASPRAEGSFVPDIIVLLTDGVTTVGPDPVVAAKQAAERGVRVYTIGFGTKMEADRGDSNFFGGRFRRGIDEETLREVSDMTGGKYYSAETASQLQDVFASLPTNLMTRTITTEITVLFAALGALLAVIAVILAQIWHPLP